ncbi:MAG: FAD-dependent thymidylate synthase [Candidatus Yanofskybacteria bacterium]|nr:FAD-dependent thymidylate synthase [Candidatus Yanofskybacteria bacterium]
MGLEALENGFNPRRKFANHHTTVEVDGVFVRLPNEEEGENWIVDRKNKTITIPFVDILQDPSIIRSARVSTGRDAQAVNEKAQGLVNALWRDSHVTPYEGGVVFRLRIQTPIMYAQPLFRLFGSHNEFSGRYSRIDGDYYTPSTLSTKQQQEFIEAEKNSQELYALLNDPAPKGLAVANEMARLVHLYRFYTKFYMTISLRHIMEFLTWENIPNRYSTTEFEDIKYLFEEIIRTWTPWSFEALQNNPHHINFYWARELVGRYPRPLELPYLKSQKILNLGEIRLLEIFGKEELMFGCLDDYPKPIVGFGHGGMTFVATMPIHVFRQWVRHRFGTITELTIDFDSVVSDRLFFVPERFRKQVGKAMQYKFEDCDDSENNQILDLYNQHIDDARKRYARLRNDNVSAQTAAMILPYCFYIPTVSTYSIHGLFNFLNLRADIHAQTEIRDYAKVIWEMFQEAFPEVAWQFLGNIFDADSPFIKRNKP